MNKFIKTILKNPILVLPKKVGTLLAKESYFIRNVTYIDELGYYFGTKIKPIKGEIGVWNNQRVVLDL